MQKVPQQPFFFGAVAAFVLAIVLGIIATILHPSINIAEKFCSALEDHNGEAMISCLSPDLQKKYTEENLIFLEALTLTDAMTNNHITCITGDAYESAQEGTRIVPVTIKSTTGKKIVDTYTLKLELQEIDGNEYIVDFY